MELLHLGIAEASSETVEALAVGVVGIGLDGADGALDGSVDTTALHLNNELAGDELSAARLDDGSRLGAPMRSGHGQGQKSEKSRGTHFEDGDRRAEKS